MAYSILTEPLKRANDSLSRCLGTGRKRYRQSEPPIIAGLHNNLYYLRDKAPANYGFQQFENERNMLIQQMQQQTKIYDDRIKCLQEASDEVIRVQQSQIFRLTKKTKRCNLEIDELLEMLLEWKELQIADRTETFVNSVMIGRDEQISEIRNQLSKTLNEQHEIVVNMNENSTELNAKIAELEKEIELRDIQTKALEKMLKNGKTEISNKEEIVLNKNRELSKLRGQLNEKEAELGEKVTSLEENNKVLEAAVKSKDMKIADLEKMLNNKKTELLDISRRLVSKDETEKRDKMPRNVGKTYDKDVESGENLNLLKKNIQYLEKKVDCRDKQIKTLEDMMNSKKMTIRDRNELLIQETKGKDAQLHNVKEQLQQTRIQLHDKETEYGRNISSLRKTVRHLKKEIEQRDLKIKDSEDILQEKEINSNKTLKEKDDQFSAQGMHLQEALKKFEDKKIEMNEQVTSLKKRIKNIEAEASNRALKGTVPMGVLGRQKNEISKDIQPNINELESTVLTLKEKLQQALSRLKYTEAELDETRTRLSKTMGDRLTDNNPNIADLSDKNRPKKLAERFSELYDNQWTDAFDILAEFSETEENTIESLLKILQESMSFCRTKGQEQMANLRRVLEFTDKHEQGGTSKAKHKILKDCRKAITPDAVGNLYQIFVSHLQFSKDNTSRQALKVNSYTKECLEICWLMAIQDPPVVFAPLFQKGSQFNTELFKPYTSSGSQVDYVVWPALLLYEDGPVLAKGIAQGLGKASGRDT